MTSTGKAAAQNGWKEFLGAATPPADLDSILRTYEMAVHYRADKASIKAFLKRALAARQHSVAVLDLTLPGLNDRISYPHLRAKFERARLLSEISTIGRAQVLMRKTMRDAAQRQGSRAVQPFSNKPVDLDPDIKSWLDKVVIPILLKKLRQEWNEEKVA